MALRTGQDDDFRRDTIERDEKRLAELGRKTVEMYVISHVLTERLEVRVLCSAWCHSLSWAAAAAAKLQLWCME